MSSYLWMFVCISVVYGHQNQGFQDSVKRQDPAHQHQNQMPAVRNQQQQQGQRPPGVPPHNQQQQQYHGQPHPNQGQHHQPPHGAHGGAPLREQIHDRDHMMEHLDHANVQRDDITEDEMQFHYFKQHDFDDNNRLDGLELLAALTHYHKGHGDDHDHGQNSVSDEQIMEYVDDILDYDDLNQDGLITYVEYKIALRKDMEKYDHPDQGQQNMQQNQQQQNQQYNQQQQNQQQNKQQNMKYKQQRN